jgi:hypothetical protein
VFDTPVSLLATLPASKYDKGSHLLAFAAGDKVQLTCFGWVFFS